MSIQKIKTKSGETKWRVRFYLDGRDSKQVKKVFATRTEAQDFKASMVEEKKVMQRIGSNTQTFEGTTFENESEYWINIRGPEFSPGHLKRVAGILKELKPDIGHIEPRYLHSEALFNLRRRLLKKNGRGEKAATPATVNRKMEVVKAILRFSADTRRIPFYPAAGYKKLQENRDDIEFWERQEAEVFLNFANRKYPRGSADRWIYVVYLLGLNTAMRAGEIWGLQSQDLKHASEVLHVQRQWDRLDLSFRLPKGKKARFVPCNEELRDEMEGLIRRKEISSLRTIFQSESGTPICHDNFSDRVFGRDVLEAKVSKITFHGLRHTGTTLMIASGIDVRTVQEICGHKNISTTMKYAHLLAESVKNASRQFSISAQSMPLRLVVNGESLK